MNLYEHEGKALLQRHGIPIPRGVLVSDTAALEEASGSFPLIAKAQILARGRGKAGGVKKAADGPELARVTGELLGSTLLGETVQKILVEEALSLRDEYYLAVTYDQAIGAPVLLFSKTGGMDVETHAPPLRFPIDLRAPEGAGSRVTFALTGSLSESEARSLAELIDKAVAAFANADARQIEINPLALTSEGNWIAADAKIALDDDAAFRQSDRLELAVRSAFGRPPTERELLAQKIDDPSKPDWHRGTASKYLELDGDIGILFSGGGASLVNMDALIAAGGKPANYTEYSGNPTREKVRELARVVLSKPGLRGLWISGGVANFTQIDETLGGIVDALREIRPSYPVVVRRAGPGEEEGRRLMEEVASELGLTVRFYGAETSMTDTAKILMNLVHGNPA